MIILLLGKKTTFTCSVLCSLIHMWKVVLSVVCDHIHECQCMFDFSSNLRFITNHIEGNGYIILFGAVRAGSLVYFPSVFSFFFPPPPPIKM